MNLSVGSVGSCRQQEAKDVMTFQASLLDQGLPGSELILDVCVWATESHPLCLLEHGPCNFSCMRGSTVGID